MLNTLIASTLFFAQWVSGAVCNDCTQKDIWFRQRVELLPEPSSFHISVACNVNFMVYVNDRNISLAPFLTPGYYEFVVPIDTKTAEIAVRTENTPDSTNIPSIWLNAWGNGFSIMADDSWQEPAIPLHPVKTDNLLDAYWSTPDKPRMHGILRYKTYEDQDSVVVYDFGKSISGIVRLTLRGASKGEKISINGNMFKAKGQTDEQLYMPLTTRQCGIAVIKSEKGQLRKKISNIEVIEIW